MIDAVLIFYLVKKIKISKCYCSATINLVNSQCYLNKIVLVLIGIPLVYGFVLALFISPTTIDVNAYHESRIILMQQQGTYFLTQFNDRCSTYILSS